MLRSQNTTLNRAGLGDRLAIGALETAAIARYLKSR